MRKLLLLLLLVAPAANAEFVVGDVVPGVVSCGVFLDSSPKVVIPAAAGQCWYDVSGVSVGPHSITMTAISTNDPVWGSQESAPSSPFAFARPSPPATPTGLGLQP